MCPKKNLGKRRNSLNWKHQRSSFLARNGTPHPNRLLSTKEHQQTPKHSYYPLEEKIRFILHLTWASSIHKHIMLPKEMVDCCSFIPAQATPTNRTSPSSSNHKSTIIKAWRLKIAALAALHTKKASLKRALISIRWTNPLGRILCFYLKHSNNRTDQ